MRSTLNLRAIFTLALLALAIGYTYIAFATLGFLSSTGRLGPGFFPRIIGMALIAVCLYSLYVDWTREEPRRASSPYAYIVIVIAAFSGAFVALLNVLGGLVAMVAFMLATLSLLNRGRHLTNLLVATLLPLAVYLLFAVWLKAGLPAGMIGGSLY